MTTKSEDVALKPCPFCGNAEVAHQFGHGGMRHACSQCGCAGPDVTGDPEEGDTWDAASTAWNTRTGELQ